MSIIWGFSYDGEFKDGWLSEIYDLFMILEQNN